MKKSTRFHYFCQGCHCLVGVELTKSTATPDLLVAAPPFLARLHWVIQQGSEKRATYRKQPGKEACKGSSRSTLRFSSASPEDLANIVEARRKLEALGHSRPLSPEDFKRISADKAPMIF